MGLRPLPVKLKEPTPQTRVCIFTLTSSPKTAARSGTRWVSASTVCCRADRAARRFDEENTTLRERLFSSTRWIQDSMRALTSWPRHGVARVCQKNPAHSSRPKFQARDESQATARQFTVPASQSHVCAFTPERPAQIRSCQAGHTLPTATNSSIKCPCSPMVRSPEFHVEGGGVASNNVVVEDETDKVWSLVFAATLVLESAQASSRTNRQN